MVYIKKFYDVAIGEPAGGETATLEQQPNTEVKETIAPKESIAAIMAKQGVKTTNDSPAKQPIVNKEKKEAPVEAKNEKVETTTTSKAETAKPESQSQTEKTEVTESKPIAQTVATEKSLQEVLKSQQPNDVLKELGYDDKTVQFFNKLGKFEKRDFFFNLLNEWENKGDLKSYLSELTTDYSKMTPEEVMRHQLSEDYSTNDQKTLDALFKNKIIKAYNLDSDDPEEVEEGKLLLNAEANKYRPTLMQRQQSKLFPPVPEPPPPVVDNSAKEAEKSFEAYKSTVLTDPYFQKIAEKKQITIGKGENKFNMSVDPDAIKNVLFDTDKWTETQFDKEKNGDGTFKFTPKVQNQILTAAFALNPQKFLDDYAQHYISIGGEKAIAPIQNASNPASITIPNNVVIDKSNPAAAMAKAGRKVSGGM